MKNHKINYVEFQAEDFSKIKKFYYEAFGWKFTDYWENYTAFNDWFIDGGFSKWTLKAKSPLIVLYSENLEESLKKVENAWGKITENIFSFPWGRRFHFQDPEKNELAIWSDK